LGLVDESSVFVLPIMSANQISLEGGGGK